MYGLTLSSAPASEPVALSGSDGLKAWLRVEHAASDDEITALGKAARLLVEKLTGRALVTQTWVLTLDNFPWPGGWQYVNSPAIFPDPHTIRVPKAPLQSVSSVEYYDLSDTLTTLAASTYVVDATTDPGRIFLAMNKVWPVTRLRPGAVRITFVAGYGAASAVPEDLKLAIKMCVAYWYENRGEAPDTNKLPPAAGALLDLTWNGEMEYGLP